MTRGVRLYLVGSLVLVALAGCSRSWLQFAEREPWRREAEVQCLKSGAVKESPVIVRADPIDGPGVCGADFPLKVVALGGSGAFGFADELRPPGSIPNAQPRWPVAQPRTVPVPEARYEVADPRYAPARTPYPSASVPGEPISLRPPRPIESTAPSHPLPRADYDPYAVESARHGRTLGAPPRTMDEQLRDLQSRDHGQPQYDRRQPFDPYAIQQRLRAPSTATAARTPEREQPRYEGRRVVDPYAIDADDRSPSPGYGRRPADRDPSPLRSSPAPAGDPLPALGPSRGMVTGSTMAMVKPAATLACPIVSALDRWMSEAVQPAAMRWFGQPVAEIRQISAYSCRGMNGQPGARISEHAFGNALDIAAFVLADGRRISVKNGWRGLPEEQGFLRDVHAAACEQFTTVLAPGSNRFHYDHIHVDLMRRPSGRRVCNPGVVSGELVAARAAKRNLARRGDPGITGSVGKSSSRLIKPLAFDAENDDWVEDEPLGRDDEP